MLAGHECLLNLLINPTLAIGMKLSRREFLKTLALLGAAAAVEAYKPEIVEALESAASGEVPVAWIQGAGCTGCTISLLQSSDPDLVEAITWFRLNVLFHPTIMLEPQHDPHGALKKLESFPEGGVLIVEGAIPEGNFCMVGERDGRPVTFEEWVEELSRKAKAVLAFGTCAAYGGIPSGYPNPTGCRGVKEFLAERGIEKPVINVPGCPPHPDWMLLTIALAVWGLKDPEYLEMLLSNLDEHGRPKWFYPDYIHNLCPRRQYFDNLELADFKQGAEEWWKVKCLWKIGCRGPVTKADCPVRKWNGGVNFCISANAPCIGCVNPDFPGKEPSPKGFYEHVSNPNLGYPKVFAEAPLTVKELMSYAPSSPVSGVDALRAIDKVALAAMGLGLAALLVRGRPRRDESSREGVE
ncbi:iron hydrogenase [Candidatus Geothermarchaeota archaeon ex4572_27]|nr:MAG: iron hydrogenase [Candidatus Geothermarchaeota archaeon ex4572_27]